jgi:hypothetical protein
VIAGLGCPVFLTVEPGLFLPPSAVGRVAAEQSPLFASSRYLAVLEAGTAVES